MLEVHDSTVSFWTGTALLAAPIRTSSRWACAAATLARAAKQYLHQLADASLTLQIDAAIDAAGADDSGHAAAAAARAFLAAVDDEW
jgi:hypothetical protein